MKKFPEGLLAILNLGEKILEVYQDEDLLEVILILDLNDDSTLVKIDRIVYDFNLYKVKKGWNLSVYRTGLNENNEVVTDKSSYINVKLIVNEE